MADISTTYGSILIGAFVAFGLSGIAGVQCIVYFNMYPKDLRITKALVSIAWAVDIMHTVLICASLAYYFITHFGEKAKADSIPWTIAMTILLTAVQTFLVQCFFAFKIFKFSRNNWYITGPIFLLALFRLAVAFGSTVEMIRLKRYSAFNKVYPGWLFTTGLSLSSGTDIIITAWLCYFLREIRARTGSTIMVQVIDALTLYTLETGALTCTAAVASLIFWIAMPKNLIFLGLHFVIGKLYANSLLASLNTRKELWRMRRPQVAHNTSILSNSDFPTQQSGTDMMIISDLSKVYRPTLQVPKLQTIIENEFEPPINGEPRILRYSPGS